MELPIRMVDDERQLRILVERARSGSAAAFGELSRRLWTRLTLWGHRFTGDRDEAEDIAQLVLLRLHRHALSFEGRSRVTSWLYRITRNIALDRRVREQRRTALVAAQGVEPASSYSDDPGSADEVRIIARLVRSYARILSRRQREIFELVDLQGVPIAEVAERLALQPVTVRVFLLRARRTIRLRMLEAHPRLLAEYRE